MMEVIQATSQSGSTPNRKEKRWGRNNAKIQRHSCKIRRAKENCNWGTGQESQQLQGVNWSYTVEPTPLILMQLKITLQICVRSACGLPPYQWDIKQNTQRVTELQWTKIKAPIANWSQCKRKTQVDTDFCLEDTFHVAQLTSRCYFDLP